MTPRFDLVVVGGINTDFAVRGPALPTPGTSVDGDDFVAGPGGKGGNAAVAATRLGARTAIVGRVGNDGRGRALLDALMREGVDVSAVGVDPAASTGAAVIQVDRTGEKQTFASLGANMTLRVAQIDAATALIRGCRVVVMQFEVPVECVLAAARLAHAAGAQIVLDPAPPRAVPDELIGLCDVIRGNACEIEMLTGQPVRDRVAALAAGRVLLARGPKAVVVGTRGGNMLVWHQGQEWLPELPVDAVDSTGAGDAFSAAFAVALGEGSSFVDAGRLASGAAALATATFGAQTGLPRRPALIAYVEAMTGTHSK